MPRLAIIIMLALLAAAPREAAQATPPPADVADLIAERGRERPQRDHDRDPGKNA